MEYGSIFETSSNRAFTREGSGFLQSDWQLFRSGRDAMKALAPTMDSTTIGKDFADWLTEIGVTE